MTFASCRREDAMPGFEIELVLPLSILMLFASKSSHTSVQEKRTVRPILRKADHVPRSGFKKLRQQNGGGLGKPTIFARCARTDCSDGGSAQCQSGSDPARTLKPRNSGCG